MLNSAIESTKHDLLVPQWAIALGITHCFVFSGKSMLPTLFPGEIIYVRPISSSPSPGDVVLFALPSTNCWIAHRVIGRKGNNLITRGDNKYFCDSAPVRVDDVLGTVVLAEFRGQQKIISGGYKGIISANMHLRISQLNSIFRQILGKPYHLLRQTGLISWLWKPEITKIILKTGNGLEIKYMHKNHVVAIWYPQIKRFECSAPYTLVIRQPEG